MFLAILDDVIKRSASANWKLEKALIKYYSNLEDKFTKTKDASKLYSRNRFASIFE
ncbi:unnamed protein product [Haemonchus placei]|uniref:Site-specific DNA-methyltransferase (adenine-specific) n=1 Tax=Haemonchus placei TaxID=6290 RepID=A0A0N4W7X6_HAEPC|nr:unnamed protein product [Haemonchus placei]